MDSPLNKEYFDRGTFPEAVLLVGDVKVKPRPTLMPAENAFDEGRTPCIATPIPAALPVEMPPPQTKHLARDPWHVTVASSQSTTAPDPS